MLALALLAAVVWPPWQTVVRSSSDDPYRFRRQPLAFVAGSPAATVPFAGLLRPEDAAAVRDVDFSRFAVVAAFALLPVVCERVEIVNLRRAGPTLEVTIARRRQPPGFGCIFVAGEAYDVVAIERPLLGRPLPRRVVVDVVQ